MLVVGYDFSDCYDLTFHTGAGRIRKLEEIENRLVSGRPLVVQADGHELETICQQFSGIPMTSNRVVRWNGEVARFIVDNINL